MARSRSAAILFAGPTGVGKTEVARQLASSLGVELDPLRHVGIYGAAHRLAPDRRASRLCRLRPGRFADRPDRPASALRAAARRDREGPSRPVQHPAAGDGPRQADRQQRQAGRFQERHPDHDDQCREPPTWPATPMASRAKREGDDTEAINKLFAPEFRNRLDAVMSFAICRRRWWRGRRQVRAAARSQLADRNVTIELSDEAANGWSSTAMTRRWAPARWRRLIQQTIKTPLADEVLFGRLERRGMRGHRRLPGAWRRADDHP
jgi:ATP-dependent Clp protease ATP-binding subunit ClpA